MTELRARLEQLGLSQYFETFVTEGFDTWDTLLDIRESDLDALKVKLGHRRKLQRAIAESRGVPLERLDRAFPQFHFSHSADGSNRSDDSASESRNFKRSEPPVPGAKRKYRRHPKADENAPERPASAYVIFSNQMREMLKGQELSFTEIAKLVGERWQTLSPRSREACEREAAAAKEKYYAELADYKRTPEYARYQQYLADFKAKHSQPQTDGKRSKVDPETSISAHGSSNDLLDSQSRRHPSDAHLARKAPHQRSGSSPPPGLSSRPGGHMFASESISPVYSFSGISSPRISGQYSPMSASPTSTPVADPSHTYGAGLPAPGRERHQDPAHQSPLSYGLAQSTPLSVASPSMLHNGQAQVDRDFPRDFPRRVHRESSSLPSLVHEDTTATTATNLSTESSGYPGGQGAPPFTGHILPLVDTQKAHRLLPQPIPSHNIAPSPLDQRPGPPSNFPQPQPQDTRQASSLAVLLRAGELAREADEPSNGRDSTS
ncbi:uncharacterized protein K452DRAFT_326624 [Aplosporella prunicola CBS 121167]|uniref:HMG box domain-containing protein n=1 Tax=Aplosporella prunicola CBS 121167 TaxID=1176127 RepID=A0A6A6BGW3_9PEZI|nr:uncharacterized protein K452DRAFT_326624 [Aplosporella prunicola CBS 121167]KAF2142107.1 hypothetical protein K452DRAFT_326624 [Aplosporella prunicola CBS 121167]